MINQKTHIEVEPMNPQFDKFLIHKSEILSVTQAKTEKKSWWNIYTKAKTIAIITTKQKDDKGNPSQLAVKNTFTNLKKLLA